MAAREEEEKAAQLQAQSPPERIALPEGLRLLPPVDAPQTPVSPPFHNLHGP